MTVGVPGDLIANRYRLLNLIGSGGFGEVWRAVDTHRSYEVALKLIRTRDRSAAWREASLLTALKSEHILEVNNADVAIDVPYLDTALAACSLDARCEPYGVEETQAVNWMRRALRGLDLCHKRGLLHRDVKPQNIFLTTSGVAKLGDFGVAGLMDASGTAPPHGDLRICAPELVTGGRATVASDVYSAACSLYALVAGRLPFAGITDQAILVDAIAHGKYPSVRDVAPNVSQALADKIRIGMSPTPGDRFVNAAAFDSVLALPERARRFSPRQPHNGHLRCWSVTGRGSAIDVCTVQGSRARRVAVETVRRPSGNRVRRLCFECAERELPVRLRAVFNDLRD
ncbi:serine/threonine-protein kinase [Mycolicibacterium elephantis]